MSRWQLCLLMAVLHLQTTDSSYNSKAYMLKHPERDALRLSGKEDVAISFSGGGARAYIAGSDISSPCNNLQANER